jgi:starvation-inducible DNA-binding protein
MLDFEQNVPLAEQLAHLLGDTVAAKFLAHGYHWNVKGFDFKEFHGFFEEIYTQFDEAIDPLAENILKLGFDAPYLLSDFMELACCADQARIENGSANEMAQSLLKINTDVIDHYKETFTLANSMNEQGIANFIADQIDHHQKISWQLRATLSLQ